MFRNEDLYTEQSDDEVGMVEDVGNDALVEENEDEGGGDIPEAEEAPGTSADDQSASKPVKPKRVVRNPQPKLNEQTLKGKKGITALESYFDRVKYKGKGHEEEDLSVILKTYEYWCHRLFPKYPFDECVAKIEKLGAKRAVVTHIKKIRLGMIIDDEPVLLNTVDSDDEDSRNQLRNEHQFDDLFDNNLDDPTPVEITEEQQERIRLNRERAERIRQERLQRTLGEESQLSLQSSNIQVELNDEEDVDTVLNRIQQTNNKEFNSISSHNNIETRSQNDNSEDSTQTSGDSSGFDSISQPHVEADEDVDVVLKRIQQMNNEDGIDKKQSQNEIFSEHLPSQPETLPNVESQSQSDTEGSAKSSTIESMLQSQVEDVQEDVDVIFNRIQEIHSQEYANADSCQGNNENQSQNIESSEEESSQYNEIVPSSLSSQPEDGEESNLSSNIIEHFNKQEANSSQTSQKILFQSRISTSTEEMDEDSEDI